MLVSRRQIIRMAAASAGFTAYLPELALAGEEASPLAPDAAVGRGLDFLATLQAADGSFGLIQRPAITGLALMAFLAAGHAPNADRADPNIGKFGAAVRGAIDFLLAQSQPDGSFGRVDKPMYGQGIATLALTQACGLDPNENQRKRATTAIANSVRLILTAQDVKKNEIYAGGWRYEPGAGDSDLSLSGWMILALRAGQDVGVAVPRAAIQRALKFVLRCYNAEGRGFAYQPGGQILPSMSSIGILCLSGMDVGRSEADAATKTLLQKPIDDATQYPYYGMYHATQAAWMISDTAGSAVAKITFDRLIQSQLADGGWPDAGESAGAGRAYSTAVALLTLAVPYRLLPAYQR